MANTNHATAGIWLRPIVLAAVLLLAPGASFARQAYDTQSDLEELQDLSGLALEVEQEDAEGRPPLSELVKVRFKAESRFVTGADFGDYSLDSYQPSARLRVSIPLAENVGIRFIGAGRMLHLDFDGSSSLGLGGSGDPIDELYSWNGRVQGAYLFDERRTVFSPRERWSLLGESYVRSNWESGARMSEALRVGGALAVGYRLGRKFELAAGASLTGNPRTGRVRVWPVVDFDWRITPDWRLRSQGLGLQLERRLGEHFTLFTRGSWESSSYRLARRSAAVGQATLRLRQVPVGAGLRWKIGRRLRVTTQAGVMALSELRVRGRGGATLTNDSARPAPYFQVRLDLRP